LHLQEFGEYRKLRDSLRMRGIGHDTLAAAAVPATAAGQPPDRAASLGRIDESGGQYSSHSDSSGGDSLDSGFEGDSAVGGGTKKEGGTGGVGGAKKLISGLLASRGKPARHGSFSEIEIDVPLAAAFPRKFHHKLSSRDAAERAASLDAWVRAMLSSYHLYSLDSKVCYTAI
jgi:hypothetical protein